MRSMLILCAALVAASLTSCSSGFKEPGDPRTINPPGSEQRVVFQRSNGSGGHDLWSVPISGGSMTRITTHGGETITSVWPGVVTGNIVYRQGGALPQQWYSVPASGGTSRQLTNFAPGVTVLDARVTGTNLLSLVRDGIVENFFNAPVAGTTANFLAATSYTDADVIDGSIEVEGGVVFYDVIIAGTRQVDAFTVGGAAGARRISRSTAPRSEIVANIGTFVLIREDDGFGGEPRYVSSNAALTNPTPKELTVHNAAITLESWGLLGNEFVFVERETVGGTPTVRVRSVPVTGSDGILTIAEYTNQEVELLTTFAGDTLVYGLVTPDDAGTTVNEARYDIVSAFVDGLQPPQVMTRNSQHIADAVVPANDVTVHGMTDDYLLFSRLSAAGVWMVRMYVDGSERRVASDVQVSGGQGFVAVISSRVVLSSTNNVGGDTFVDLYAVDIGPGVNQARRLSITSITQAMEPYLGVGTCLSRWVFRRGDDFWSVDPAVANSELRLTTGNASIGTTTVGESAVFFILGGSGNLFSVSPTASGRRQISQLGTSETITAIDHISSTRIVFSTAEAGSTRPIRSGPVAPTTPGAINLTNAPLGTEDTFLFAY